MNPKSCPRPPTSRTKALPYVGPKPWDKLQDFLPALSTYELDELTKSIAKHGVLQPIFVLPDGRIIDGFHRWKLSAGKAPFKVLKMSESDAFMLGVIMNIARRNLSHAQLKRVRLELWRDRKKLKRLILALRKAKKTQAQVASETGVPQQTISRIEKGDTSFTHLGNACIPDCRVSIPKQEHEQIFKRIKAGEAQRQIAADYKVSQQRVSQIVKRVDTKKHQKTPELPKGEYNVILADPPWKYDFEISSTRDIEAKYPTMGLEEICILKIPTTSDSVLFLWTPMPKLREGLHVLEKWGFEYKTGLVWVKDKIGMGYYARSRHELVLIGIKGEMHPPEPEHRPDSVIIAPRKKHSRKPSKLHEIIEKMYPHGKYLELFARTRRKNWIAWGNEVGD